MDAAVWSLVAMSIALIIAGTIAWWLARGCVVTITGAVGAIVAGVASVVCLAFLLDSAAAVTISLILAASGGVWLLCWAIAGGIRGQRLDRTHSAVAGQDEAPQRLHSA